MPAAKAGVSVAVTAGMVAEVAPTPEVAETKAVVPAHEVRVVPVPPATGIVPDGVAVVEGPPGTTDAITLVPETKAVTDGEDIAGDGYFSLADILLLLSALSSSSGCHNDFLRFAWCIYIWNPHSNPPCCTTTDAGGPLIGPLLHLPLSRPHVNVRAA